MVTLRAYPFGLRAAHRRASARRRAVAWAGSARRRPTLGDVSPRAPGARAMLLNNSSAGADLRGETPQKGYAMRPVSSLRLRPVLAAALTVLLPLMPLAAQASTGGSLPPLREVEEIDRNMLWVALAIEISDRCDQIAPRNLKGLLVLNDLRARARDLGYSNAEIEDYATSDAEKARMRQLGEQYVKSQGLDPDVPADLCSLGAAEIARNSRIGALLKAK